MILWKKIEWTVFAILAAFPISYYGYELDWNGWTIVTVLVWGATVSAIAAYLSERA